MSLNRYRLRHLARKGRPAAVRVLQLLTRPDRLLGVILIGNTFANIFASAVATILAAHFFGDFGIFIATIVLTFVVLIFGETAPKTLAALYPERVAFPASVILNILLKVFYPFVWLVNIIANTILRLFGIDVRKSREDSLSTEELRSIVHEASGKISKTHKQLLLRILDLEKVTVEDVMIPRADIYGIDCNDTWDNILAGILNCPHEFVPIYRDDIDQVLGMLNLRKILAKMQQTTIDKDVLLANLDKVYFVPEDALLNRQLLHFQAQAQNVGIVVDEYGDIQGMVTLQDVVEEIVGEFTQSIDWVDRMVKKQKDGSYIIDCRITIRDLNRMMSWHLPIDGPKTLSGLIVEYLETIPQAGVCLKITGLGIEVLKVRGNAVKLVKAVEV